MKKNPYPKSFKDFITKNINFILDNADLSSQTYTIEFMQEYKHDEDDHTSSGVTADIQILDEYQKFNIRIYRIVFDDYKAKKFGRILDVLCHEIGHLYTNKLYQLIVEPYKSEREVDKANEELTTKIGNYLYNICNDKFNYKF